MKKSNSRNTLAKEIRKEAIKPGYHAPYNAAEIAEYGRRLTELESIFRSYYASKASTKALKDGLFKPHCDEWVLHKPNGKTRAITYLQVHQFTMRHVKKGLCQRFMEAVDKDDFEAIHAMAEAVRFFTKNKYPVHQYFDPDRAALLWLKKRIRYKSEWLTIREIAEWVMQMKNPGMTYEQVKKMETPADGFSALRRKCQELKLPVAPSRKTKTK